MFAFLMLSICPARCEAQSYMLNPMVSLYPADHDYCRFQYVLLVDQITVIRNEMCV